MAEGFKVGDVVQLKSGGPYMKVIAVKGDRVVCTWRDGGKLEQVTFPQDLLRKISGPTHSWSA